MNIPLLAADIASRIPNMALDSQINNADFLERLIRQYVEPKERPPKEAVASLEASLRGSLMVMEARRQALLRMEATPTPQ